jgi:hypothetical protein
MEDDEYLAILNVMDDLGATMTSRAAASQQASLSSLSSDLLMQVTHFLSIEELCVFDTAINNKLLRAKYLSGLRNDTFLYPGAADPYLDPEADWEDEKCSAWQEAYVQWLTMRRVFVNSILLNDQTTAAVLLLYDTMNMIQPGLVSLIIHRDADFPMDIALRNVKTLRKLELRNYGNDWEVRDASRYRALRKCMASVREWGSKGGSLEVLVLTECDFGDQAVDFGCLSLTELTIKDYHNPTNLQEQQLLWGILHTCKNLKRFKNFSRLTYHVPNGQDLGMLARFCPDLEHLHIETRREGEVDAAILCGIIAKCKLQHLIVDTMDATDDIVIVAIAANLVSLQTLTITKPMLQDMNILGLLSHGCPQLQELRIIQENGNGSLTEAELLYLVKHAKNLQLLTIVQRHERGDLDYLRHCHYTPQDLLNLGVEDAEAFVSKQQSSWERLDKLRAAAEKVGNMYIHIQ